MGPFVQVILYPIGISGSTETNSIQTLKTESEIFSAYIKGPMAYLDQAALKNIVVFPKVWYNPIIVPRRKKYRLQIRKLHLIDLL